MGAVAKCAKKLWKVALAKIQNKKKPRIIADPEPKPPSPGDVVTDLSPFIQVLRDGTVKRLHEQAYNHPSGTGGPNIKVFSKDVVISTSTNLSARIYLPRPKMANSTGRELPIFVYYHGGGFFLDSATSTRTHGYMNQLVLKANVIAVSVDYRRAPESPLPAAFDDSWEALQWVASHALEQQKPIHPSHVDMLKGGINMFQKKLGLAGHLNVENPNPSPKEDWLIKHGDFSRLFVGGDSTGGTIAHYLSSMVGPNPNHLAGGVKILGTILCFPFFCDASSNRESMLYKMWKLAYPKCPNGIDNKYINPFRRGPRQYPFQFKTMFVCYGEKDEYGNIAMRFVEAMRKDRQFSGGVTVVSVGDEEHCFHLLNPTSSRAKSLIQDIASFIHR